MDIEPVFEMSARQRSQTTRQVCRHLDEETNVTKIYLQGSTLAVFRYPEHPRFYDGIPDSPAQ